MQSIVAEISLSKIRQNALSVKKFTKKPLFAVVKDDGYGHGALAVAGALNGLADLFAVATAEEGAALRIGGVKEDILVLSPALDEEDVLRLVHYGLIGTVSSPEALSLILSCRKKFDVLPRVHVSVNTGMNRYGFLPHELASMLRRARRAGLTVEGLYSHYYLPGHAPTREKQRRIFIEAAATVKEIFPGCKLHLAATGGMLAGGELFDGVRCGLALYGYLPSKRGALNVKPAMQVYAYVSHSTPFTGGGVGYAACEKKYQHLHTLRLGYGDGFFRAGGLGIGKLCMDACIREGAGGFATRQSVLKDVSGYARQNGTVEYEVLVDIGRRARRIYKS